MPQYLLVAVLKLPCGALLQRGVGIIRVALHVHCELVFTERGANEDVELHLTLMVGSGVPAFDIVRFSPALGVAYVLSTDVGDSPYLLIGVYIRVVSRGVAVVMSV